LVQGDVVRDYVKWDDQPASLQSAVESFIRGHRIAMSDPRGPIYLCFDTDLQEMRLEERVTVPDVNRYGPAAPVQADPTMLATAAEWLIEAEHPVVLVDYTGRNQQTVPALVELAELLALPVVDLGSRYNFPNMHPLDATEAEDQLLPDADVALAFDVTDMQWATSTVDRTSRLAKPYLNPRAKVAHISLRDMNIRAWAQEHGRLHPVDLPITADTSLAIPALSAMCRAALERTPGVRDRVTERAQRVERVHRSLHEHWRETAERKMNEHPISLPRLASDLWDVVKDEDWMLVNRTLRDWTRRLWEWSKPTLPYVGAHRGGGVGYGLAHSIGAALAVGRERLCIDIQPDGDLLFTPSALWTAAHHRIPLLIVMFNNRSYYNDEDHQILMAKARTRPVENSGIGLHMVDPPVDFAALAKGFGIEAWGPIEAPSDLKPALERAVRYVLKERKAALVDVVTQAR
jgi:thiamine pyrophosphate-dependent acetolactate synthase large subunit-like protein